MSYISSSAVPVPAASASEGTATLTDYGVIARRQWWVLLLAVVLGVLGAGAYTAGQPRSYTSSTQVLVTPTGVDDNAVLANARTRAEINLDTEAQLLTSTAVVQAAADILDSELTLPALADRVRVSVPPNTEVLTIAFDGPTPQAAQAGADAFAVSYLANRRQAAADQLAGRQATRRSQVETLTASLQDVTAGLADLPPTSADRSVAEAQISSLSAQIAVLTAESDDLSASALTPGRTITEADLPGSPSSPVVPTNLAGGGMLGLLLGSGVALLRHRRDRSLRDAAQVLRHTGQRVIAVLPEGATVGLADPEGAAGRAYARLRNVVTARAATDAQVLLIAGVTNSGSAVACDLAVALARTGAEVVLIQADTESDTAARLGITSRGVGLSDVLKDPARLAGALRPATRAEGVLVLTPGTEPERSAALLQTDVGANVLAELRGAVRWVILDGPVAAHSNHVQSLARHCDAAVVVVHARDSVVEDVMDTAEQIAAARTPMLGIVLVSAGRGRHARVRPAHTTLVEPPADRSVSLDKGAGTAGSTAERAEATATAIAPAPAPATTPRHDAVRARAFATRRTPRANPVGTSGSARTSAGRRGTR